MDSRSDVRWEGEEGKGGEEERKGKRGGERKLRKRDVEPL
jgi:hypothetical protein